MNLQVTNVVILTGQQVPRIFPDPQPQLWDYTTSIWLPTWVLGIQPEVLNALLTSLSWLEKRLGRPHQQLMATGKGEIIFFSGVATCSLPMLQ